MLRKKSKIALRQLAYLFIGLSFPAFTAHSSEVDVSFSGTLLYPPPCKVSASKTVDFGKIIIDSVADTTRDINLELDCSDAQKNALKIGFEGEREPDNANAWFKTNVPRLGIGIVNGDTEVRLDYWINFTSDTQPDLKVKLKRWSAAQPSFVPGKIEGSFTIIIMHQ
ncbi:fimbrial protein [Enterobacter bugandensis]|uniref:fimbrial protein n=1 Tax=Enterobacter bugandensis TaxID=881260 RepID=UPI0021D19FB2|nr:fimbrial protein [Enterobacter bugandensis]MCU6216065.1 fimbrial protein [Enterobacter bugandensis]